MNDVRFDPGSAALWIAVAAALVVAVVLFFWYKGRAMPGAHVFRASRLSRGNLLFPTKVAVTPDKHRPLHAELVGGREQSMHPARRVGADRLAICFCGRDDESSRRGARALPRPSQGMQSK